MDKKIISLNQTLLNEAVKEQSSPVMARSIEHEILRKSKAPVKADQKSIDLGSQVVEEEVNTVIEEPQGTTADEVLEVQLATQEPLEAEVEEPEAPQQTTESKDWKTMLHDRKYMILGAVAAVIILYVLIKKVTI